MKCKICGYRAADIGALSKHRSKKHPTAVKKARGPRKPKASGGASGKFCTQCGKRL